MVIFTLINPAQIIESFLKLTAF